MSPSFENMGRALGRQAPMLATSFHDTHYGQVCSICCVSPPRTHNVCLSVDPNTSVTSSFCHCHLQVLAALFAEPSPAVQQVVEDFLFLSADGTGKSFLGSERLSRNDASLGYAAVHMRWSEGTCALRINRPRHHPAVPIAQRGLGSPSFTFLSMFDNRQIHALYLFTPCLVAFSTRSLLHATGIYCSEAWFAPCMRGLSPSCGRRSVHNWVECQSFTIASVSWE